MGIKSKNVNVLRVCKNITSLNFSYSKVYPGTKYVEKVEKNEGKPSFQNIKDLTNGSSKINKVGRSERMFFKTRPNPYKGFRSSRPEVFCEKDVLESFSKFAGKQLLWGLVLIKLQPKKRLHCRWFSLDIAKVSRKPFL